MNNYYIYIYLDPRKFEKYCYENFSFLYKPFYVGKGLNNRYKEIGENRRSDYFMKKINKIKKSGLEPIVFKLYENLNEEESLYKETELINEINIKNPGILVNMTDGGEGVSGYKHAEKILKKLRKNFEEIKTEFENRNYILLTKENEYKNAHQKLNYICKKCDHEHSIRWSELQQKQGCPYCTKKKIDFSDIKKEFERRNYKLLTKENEYKNNKTKLNYICSNGHKGFMNWHNFHQGHSCSICGKEIQSEKMKGKNSKLTEIDIIHIKLFLEADVITQQKIANMFGISQYTVSLIKNNKIWSHIKI